MPPSKNPGTSLTKKNSKRSSTRKAYTKRFVPRSIIKKIMRDIYTKEELTITSKAVDTIAEILYHFQSQMEATAEKFRIHRKNKMLNVGHCQSAARILLEEPLADHGIAETKKALDAYTKATSTSS